MNYATNFAIVKNGTVTNLLKGLVYNTMDDFPNAVHTENLDVQIGDTYENGVFMRDGQVVTGSNVGVQSDWNQNDDTQPDYVKNRPFYTGDPVETVLVEEITATFTESGSGYLAEFQSTFEATVGETYSVSWDGTAYECTCVSFNNTPVIGNLSVAGYGSDTGEPFLMLVNNGVKILIAAADASTSHTFSISGTFIEIKKIDTKYIPWNDAIGLSPPVFIDKSISALTDEEKQEYYNLFNKGSLVLARSDSGNDDHWCVVLYMNYSKTIGLNMTLIDSGHLKTYSGGSWEDSDIRQSGIELTIGNLLDERTVWGLLSKNSDSVSVGEAFSAHINWNDSTGKASIQKTLKSQYVGSSYIENSDILCSGDKEIVLSSSTTNSTKKFKITVDDSGTISATEVT